jgi:hypothetical protein
MTSDEQSPTDRATLPGNSTAGTGGAAPSSEIIGTRVNLMIERVFNDAVSRKPQAATSALAKLNQLAQDAKAHYLMSLAS